MTTKTPHARVVGRLFWDAKHPSPWMTFDHKTAFHRWTTEVRKARPGTKTEWHYIDLVWTADAMLGQIQRDAAEDARLKDYPTYSNCATCDGGGCGDCV